MKFTHKLWLGSVVLNTFIFLGSARGQTQMAKSAISRTGTTVLNATSPKGKVEVSISTVKLNAACSDASPLRGMLKQYSIKEITFIDKLDISINGKPLVVPGSVYAFLFDPLEATLRFEEGSLILRIDGGDASTSYFERVYFDENGVNRLKSYSSLAPDKPTVDTRFYQVVVKDD